MFGELLASDSQIRTRNFENAVAVSGECRETVSDGLGGLLAPDFQLLASHGSDIESC